VRVVVGIARRSSPTQQVYHNQEKEGTRFLCRLKATVPARGTDGKAERDGVGAAP
jgi:hypothetical protein